MAELNPAPFADLVSRLYLEPQAQETLFALPRRRWYIPAADSKHDLTVHFHGKLAGNAAGPAAGPHTQMAQNILLSYVAGPHTRTENGAGERPTDHWPAVHRHDQCRLQHRMVAGIARRRFAARIRGRGHAD